MATISDLPQMWVGTSANYEALETKIASAIYFLTDTHQIVRGNVKFSQEVQLVSSLPESGIRGYIYFNTTDNIAYIYTGSEFKAIVDLSGYYTKGETDSEINTKVNAAKTEITPNIDPLTNHWRVGSEDTGVSASGALWQIPRTFYSYNDATYGACNRLDATVDVLELADRFDSLSGLKLEVQSASDTISGNIALRVTLTDGTTTQGKPVTVAVGTTSAWQVIDLTGITLRSGKLTITRDYSATADTLKDGETVVTAVVTAVRYKELD